MKRFWLVMTLLLPKMLGLCRSAAVGKAVLSRHIAGKRWGWTYRRRSALLQTFILFYDGPGDDKKGRGVGDEMMLVEKPGVAGAVYFDERRIIQTAIK